MKLSVPARRVSMPSSPVNHCLGLASLDPGVPSDFQRWRVMLCK